uniref:Serpentine receptor class gamma n=1 Tax=Rhabditophanes sp. KR3021 TaxID=114890 RepID=A0AC35TLT8_9BILA
MEVIIFIYIFIRFFLSMDEILTNSTNRRKWKALNGIELALALFYFNSALVFFCCMIKVVKLIKRTSKWHINFRKVFLFFVLLMSIRASIGIFDGVIEVYLYLFGRKGIKFRNDSTEILSAIRSIINNLVRLSMYQLIFERVFATRFRHIYEKVSNSYIILISSTVCVFIAAAFYSSNTFFGLNKAIQGSLLAASNIPMPFLIIYVKRKNYKVSAMANFKLLDLNEKFLIRQNLCLLKRSLSLIISKMLSTALYAIRDYGAAYGLMYYYSNEEPIQKLIRITKKQIHLENRKIQTDEENCCFYFNVEFEYDLFLNALKLFFLGSLFIRSVIFPKTFQYTSYKLFIKQSKSVNCNIL